MIALNSDLHRALKQSLVDAERDSTSAKWSSLLNSNAVSDGALALLDFGLSSPIFTDVVSKENLNDWFLNIREWRISAVLDPSMSDKPPDVGARILFALWENISSTLSRLLRDAKVENPNFPQEGGVLLFVGGLSKCLVVSYTISGSLPVLWVVAVVDEPRSVFDFWEAADHVDPMRRNHLKRILGTGHKIVVHRGVIVPIDRNLDSNVFGPSIDTLIISELLAQQIFEADNIEHHSALEVGCGNGLITAALAHHCKGLREIFSIDINFGAVSRTRRNVFSSLDFIANPSQPTTYFICGPFQPDLIARKFDLVVCNPPYIPIPTQQRRAHTEGSDFYQAVGGTDLMRHVLQSTPQILTNEGQLLIMTSNLSRAEFVSSVPSAYSIAKPVGNGISVVFDVEAVLNNADWLNFLINERGLTQEPDGTYSHVLQPVWISKELGR